MYKQSAVFAAEVSMHTSQNWFTRVESNAQGMPQQHHHPHVHHPPDRVRILLTPSQDGIKLFSLLPALLASLYHDQLHPFIPFEAILVLRKQLRNLLIEHLVQPVHLSFVHLQINLTLYARFMVQVHIISQKYLLP